MFQVKRGHKALSFGTTEKTLSLNWHSLIVSLTICLLTWASTELVPSLQSHGGTLALIAGAIAQISPMVILFLRSNRDTTVDVPIKLEK